MKFPKSPASSSQRYIIRCVDHYFQCYEMGSPGRFVWTRDIAQALPFATRAAARRSIERQGALGCVVEVQP